MNARLLRFVALPVFVLYTVLLHSWTVWMAFRLSQGVGEGITTLALPVASWVYWLDKIPLDSVRAGFASSVGTWFVSAALLIAAGVANRRFHNR